MNARSAPAASMRGMHGSASASDRPSTRATCSRLDSSPKFAIRALRNSAWLREERGSRRRAVCAPEVGSTAPETNPASALPARSDEPRGSPPSGQNSRSTRTSRYTSTFAGAETERGRYDSRCGRPLRRIEEKTRLNDGPERDPRAGSGSRIDP